MENKELKFYIDLKERQKHTIQWIKGAFVDKLNPCWNFMAYHKAYFHVFYIYSYEFLSGSWKGRKGWPLYNQ